MYFMVIKILSILIAPILALWVRHHESKICKQGRQLSEEETKYAIDLGILCYDKVYILEVAKVPSGLPPFIEKWLQRMHFPAGNAAGMSMRYGIYIDKSYRSNIELIRHELVHTAQYEHLGSLRKFLQLYIYQMMALGYQNAPLEMDARERSEIT